MRSFPGEIGFSIMHSELGTQFPRLCYTIGFSYMIYSGFWTEIVCEGACKVIATLSISWHTQGNFVFHWRSDTKRCRMSCSILSVPGYDRGLKSDPITCFTSCRLIPIRMSRHSYRSLTYSLTVYYNDW